MTDKKHHMRPSSRELKKLVAQVDAGGRHPQNMFGRALLVWVPVVWALFQLWYASPFAFSLGFGMFNDTEARAIHLGFALFLGFLAYPMFKNSNRHIIPWYDYVLAVAGAFCASYIYLFYAELAGRSGAPTVTDLAVSGAGMLLLLLATWRTVGPPLTIVALVFLAYTFLGPYMPDVVAHKGASINKAASHFWLTTEGVFGVALGVSTSFVFLFVLFGSLLEKAGAGNYFVKTAFSLLGHLRGGPAKAAVVASGLSGIISGSSIANVVTTGTFTIPLMKKVGFPDYKAGAVEVAASTNGQLTPPIMGAAAFLMVEYVGISYLEVIKHAALPALISYIALLYIVHIEAVKAGMKGIERPKTAITALKVANFVGSFALFGLMAAAVYYGLGWVKDVFGEAASFIASAVMAVVYVALVQFGSRFPKLDDDGHNMDLTVLPPIGATVKTGLYFLLPVAVLVWCLMVERFSPGLSAFWATLYMMFIVVTHRPLDAFFRKEGKLGQATFNGLFDLFEGLSIGARNMIGIGIATAAAGVVVGTVTLTGIGLVMTEFVEFISGGNIMLMLLFTAFISLVLGMGLPTTANYIVVSTLMAPVIVTVGAENGLMVPLIAIHLFVFYFGILADDTPPVGLAAFAASAIARSDPIKTGLQGFAYDIRTAILPFMFIFNTELLMIGVHSWWEFAATVGSAVLAMLAFASATQGFMLVKSRVAETLLLLLATFMLLRPGYFWDKVYDPYEHQSAANLYQVAEQAPENGFIRMHVSGITLEGDAVNKAVILPLDKAGASGAERLAAAGLTLQQGQTADELMVSMVRFGSPAAKLGVDYGFVVDQVLVEANRPPKQLLFIPAVGLVLLVYGLQRRRLRKSAAVA